MDWAWKPYSCSFRPKYLTFERKKSSFGRRALCQAILAPKITEKVKNGEKLGGRERKPTHMPKSRNKVKKRSGNWAGEEENRLICPKAENRRKKGKRLHCPCRQYNLFLCGSAPVPAQATAQATAPAYLPAQATVPAYLPAQVMVRPRSRPHSATPQSRP